MATPRNLQPSFVIISDCRIIAQAPTNTRSGVRISDFLGLVEGVGDQVTVALSHDGSDRGIIDTPTLGRLREALAGYEADCLLFVETQGHWSGPGAVGVDVSRGSVRLSVAA